jgi:hypothetical protein
MVCRTLPGPEESERAFSALSLHGRLDFPGVLLKRSNYARGTPRDGQESLT